VAKKWGNDLFINILELLALPKRAFKPQYFGALRDKLFLTDN